jgi:Tol biopolymer transport system component
VNLGSTVNTYAMDEGPFISPDGLMLLFHSDRPGGQGYGDIYVTTRPTITSLWGTPVNLGSPVNSSYWEFNPEISRDGSTLYFVSIRPGGVGDFDLWQVPIFPVADLNKDGTVDFEDFAIFAEYWLWKGSWQ